MRKNFVPLAARLAALACLSSALSFAGNWSGILVDSRCWDIQENNRGGTLVYDGRDGNLEIRLCSPGAKTKSFAVVQQDGLSFKLDAPGNAKAAELAHPKDVSLGAIYVTLDRMEDKGLVSSRLSDPRPERGGRAKRYFRVTNVGVRALKMTRSALTNLWSGLALLEGRHA